MQVPFVAGCHGLLRLRIAAKNVRDPDVHISAIVRVAEIAAEYDVPVLLHFQSNRYNTSFERFHAILEKFPKVNFIGHAQTWWANIDAQADQAVLYPKGPIAPGGLTDPASATVAALVRLAAATSA